MNPIPALPHKAPFLLLDRTVATDRDGGTFAKNVCANDPCLAADGTMPAVFVLEAMAQAGGAVLAAAGDAQRNAGPLAKVDGFRVHEPVRVGDEMHVEARLVRYTRGVSIFEARVTVEGRLCAEGRISLAVPLLR